MNIPLIDKETVVRLLEMPACIDLMATTQAAISRGEIEPTLRSSLPIAEVAGRFLVMPGVLPQAGVFGAKLATLYPENRARGLPTVQGHIALFDEGAGAPLAVVDAGSVTAIRTAAASGAATRLLARWDASTLALLGCGEQAQTHLEAMLAVRPVRQVRVWGRDFDKAGAFAARQSDRVGVPVVAAADAREVVAGADLVCTVTGSHTPILEGGWLAAGAHLNLVGAHSPTTREVDGTAMGRARVFTEITEFALAEAGDLLLAIGDGLFSASDIVGEIGDAIDGKIPGRLSEDDITIYKNLGNTAQDLAAAHYVYSQVKGQSAG